MAWTTKVCEKLTKGNNSANKRVSDMIFTQHSATLRCTWMQNRVNLCEVISELWPGQEKLTNGQCHRIVRRPIFRWAIKTHGKK